MDTYSLMLKDIIQTLVNCDKYLKPLINSINEFDLPSEEPLKEIADHFSHCFFCQEAVYCLIEKKFLEKIFLLPCSEIKIKIKNNLLKSYVLEWIEIYWIYSILYVKKTEEKKYPDSDIQAYRKIRAIIQEGPTLLVVMDKLRQLKKSLSQDHHSKIPADPILYHWQICEECQKRYQGDFKNNLLDYDGYEIEKHPAHDKLFGILGFNK